MTQITIAQMNTEIVFEADKNGNTIIGSKAKLIEFIRNGTPVRVGWILEFQNSSSQQIEKIEHWTNAGFVTIIKNDVFAQINSISQQIPRMSSPPSVSLVDEHPNSWLAIIGTTGVLEQRYVGTKLEDKIVAQMRAKGASNEEIEKQLQSMRKMNVRTKWAVILE